MAAARAVIALLTLVTVTGCATITPVQSPSPSGPAAESWPSDTSIGRLLGQVGDDGSVSEELALQAFSTVIAPLPGVPASTGGAPNDHERADGSFAIDWLLAYVDQLTPEQKAVVDSVLTHSETAIVVPKLQPIAQVGGAPPRMPAALPASAKAKPFTDAIAAAEAIIAGKLGRKLQAHISFDFATAASKSTAPDAGDALAFAYADVVFGQNIYCEIRATPALVGQSQQRINVTMAHEVFHCFQYERLFDHGRSAGRLNPWIIEGQAEWAGEDVAGPGQDGRNWWSNYLSSPRRSLFARAYDAVGFYEHLVEVGKNPWSIFDAMLANVNDSSNAFKAAGAADDAFLDTWASGVFRVNGLPPAWSARERWGVVGSGPSTNVPTFANGSQYPIVVTPGIVQDVMISSTAHVTKLSFQGHVRMHSGNLEVPNLGGDTYLCTQQGPNACKCPEGFTYSGPPLTQSDGVVWLALTGGLSGSQGSASGHDIKEFCEEHPTYKPTKPPKPKAKPKGGPNPCAKGCGGSNGDPHMQTIDKRDYDLQAAGEYVLLRNADGSIEIQDRQTPYPTEADVSINTALAWRVAGRRVAMYANFGSDGYSLTLDGQPLDPQTFGTMDLGGGAFLSAFDEGIEVAYPDGTLSTAFFHGSTYVDAIDIVVAPSDAFRAEAVGLLAPIPDGSELPALPDGSVLPLSQDRAVRFEQRYRQLTAAWHVTDQTSLFDYGPGESTATFDVPNFPSENVAFDLAELQIKQGLGPYQDAVTKCQGVSDDQSFFLDCVFDIMATKDPAYAQYYELIKEFQALGPAVLDTGPAPTAPPPPTPSTSLPQGFFQVASDVSLIRGTTVDAAGTVYASLLKTDFSPVLVAVDAATGASKGSVTTSGSGSLFLLDGSLWMAEDDPTGYGKCLLERFDPATLASQAKIEITCDISGANAAAVSDGIWWVDGSNADGNGPILRHVSPATNAVDRSVALPFASGYLTSSGDTLIYGDGSGQNGWYRLTAGAGSFAPLPVPAGTYAAFASGDGAWLQPSEDSSSLPQADFITGSETPDKVMPIDGSLIGADTNSIYVAGLDATATNTLVRYVDAATAPAVIATGATVTTAAGDQTLSFFDNDPFVVANQQALKLWIVREWPNAGVTSVVGTLVSVP